MATPSAPKIYHIVHMDRLPSIIENGFLWCDAVIANGNFPGTTIGLVDLKTARRNNNLPVHEGLCVGDCVPFYFCPRSVMLYVIHMKNHEALAYRDGQEQIVHLAADFFKAVSWADNNKYRWAFTTSNAGSRFFECYCNPDQLDRIDWAAVRARHWSYCKDEKQAEFLTEHCFPWSLVERVGVYSKSVRQGVVDVLQSGGHRPPVEVDKSWYY